MNQSESTFQELAARAEVQPLKQRKGRPGEMAQRVEGRSWQMLPLTMGKWAIVDDEDFDSLCKSLWCAHKNTDLSFYAKRSIRVNGKTKNIKMHRQLMNCPENLQVDHINRNTLDNRKCNLRVCNASQNRANIGLKSNNTTGYKGVNATPAGVFRAHIEINGKNVSLGRFINPRDAAKCYDDAAKKQHGEYAWLNFPDDLVNENCQPPKEGGQS